MKKISLIVIFGLMWSQLGLAASSFLSSSQTTGLGQNSDGTSVGPFAITDAFCADFSKLGALLNSFQIVQWPVAGFPGVVIGLTQRTSVINDICTFLTELESKNGINAVFFAADYLNELTGKKWDTSLKLAHQTWDLTNSIYDFDNGGVRPGALTSESTARDMNDWMEASYHWYGKTANNEDVYIQHRTERENEMAQFSQLSYQKATLQDASKCPEPADSNTNYSKIYTTQVKPNEVARDNANDYMSFYKQQLFYMGPKFMNNAQELKEYTSMLNNMLRDGVYYQMVEADVTKTTFKPTGTYDANDDAVMQKTNVKQKAYNYTVVTDAKTFTDFKTRWNSQWSTWVTAQWSSQGSFGALTGDAKDRVENDFKDINYECNEAQLTQGMDQSAPNYELKKDQVVKQCRDNVVMNQKKSQNLLDYYSTQLEQTLYTFKNSNAQIWTLESKYAGVNRLIPLKGTANQTGSTFQEDGISCSNTLSEAEMGKIQVQQQSVNNGLTEIIAKETVKDAATKDNENIEAHELQDEENNRKVMSDSRNKDLEKANTNVQQPFKVQTTW